MPFLREGLLAMPGQIPGWPGMAPGEIDATLRQGGAQSVAPGVAAGDLVALPILVDPDGAEVDLMAFANNRPALLLLASGSNEERCRLSETLAALRQEAERSGIALILVLRIGAETVVDAGSALVAVDRESRFAFTLGLAPPRDAGAAVLLSLDSVGCVVEVSRVVDRPSIASALARLAARPDVAASAGFPGF